MAVTLAVSSRSAVGTAASRALRREGKVPGVLYGGADGPVNFSVPKAEVLAALDLAFAEGQLFRIAVDGAKPVTAILRELQNHFLDGGLQHLDFWAVEPGREVETRAWLVPTGNWDTQRAKGFFIETKSVRLFGPAKALPGVVNFDVSGLKDGDKLRLDDLDLPDGVRIAEHGRTVVCRQ
ncbi:50S ribosomal protein L25 [bacterium]|nr:50S ribosomal protein L25 [bacterium]